MASTKIGGLKAAATNKAKHGADFYKMIGQKGGKNGHTGGFAANPTLAALAGAKGGRISKRGKATRPNKPRTPKLKATDTVKEDAPKKVYTHTRFADFIKKFGANLARKRKYILFK